MMKPAGSPPGSVVDFFVAGSVTVSSDECSARTCVIVICGPSGCTLPPLPKRTACSAVSQPRSIMLWINPAGPYTLAPVRLAMSTASHEPSVRPTVPTWSPWPWLTSTRSTFPSLARSLYSAGVLGFPVRKGSVTITLPPGVVILNVAWPSHSTSTFPGWAKSSGADSARKRATTSAPPSMMTLRGWEVMSRSPCSVGLGRLCRGTILGSGARGHRGSGPSRALDPYVLQRAGVGEAPDQVDSRLLDAWPDAPDERQLIDRDLDHAVVENALDLVDQPLPLLWIRLPRLALEQILDLGNHP